MLAEYRKNAGGVKRLKDDHIPVTMLGVLAYPRNIRALEEPAFMRLKYLRSLTTSLAYRLVFCCLWGRGVNKVPTLDEQAGLSLSGNRASSHTVYFASPKMLHLDPWGLAPTLATATCLEPPGRSRSRARRKKP